MSSILLDVKKVAEGIAPDYDHFDQDLILHTNTALSILAQLGVGPKNGFLITDDSQTWEDFMGNDPRFNMAKSYVIQKVRLLFDPPLGSAVIEAMNKSLDELAWRIAVASDEVSASEEPKSDDLDNYDINDVIDEPDLSDDDVADILAGIGS